MKFFPPSNVIPTETYMHMKRLLPLLLLATGALPSCQTAHDAAVASFRVIDAPHQYIRRKLDIDENGDTTTTTSTTTVQSEAPPNDNVYAPPYQQPPPQYVGRNETVNVPPPAPPQPPPRRVVATEQSRAPESEATSTPAPRVTTRSTTTSSQERANESRSSSTPRTASSEKSSLPYGKPVPGKPGYVFSPYDKNGGYVDVTGFAPGSKVKDPYSGKIFLVP
jgi:hypothetical protein